MFKRTKSGLYVMACTADVRANVLFPERKSADRGGNEGTVDLRFPDQPALHAEDQDAQRSDLDDFVETSFYCCPPLRTD